MRVPMPLPGASPSAAHPADTPTRAGWWRVRSGPLAAAISAVTAFACDLRPPFEPVAPVLYVLALFAAGFSFRPRHLVAIAAAISLLIVAAPLVARAAGGPMPDLLASAIALFGVWTATMLLRTHRSGFVGDAAEDGFRAVMDTAADAIIVIDTHGRIDRFNAAAERLFGYSALDVIGENVSILMPEPHRSRHEAYLSRYLRTGESHIVGQAREMDVVRRDGTLVPVKISVGEGHGTDGRYFVGILHDISRRKETEFVLHRLHEITAAPTLDLDAKIQRVLELGTRFFKMDTGMLCRAENGILSIRNMAPPTTRLEEDASFAAARAYVLGTVAAHDAVCSDSQRPDAHAGSPPPAGGELAVGYLGAPVIVDWCLHGVLCFVSAAPRPSPISQGEREMLQLLAHWVALEVGRAAQIKALSETQDELRRQAQTDGLTGILNRRHFMRMGKIELERCSRYDHELGLILLDADHFKLINDTHGHGVGDAVLVALTAACSRMLRGSDLFGRIGGEEFALLLPETSADATRVVAERIRETVAALRVPAADGEVTLTASLGITGRLPTDVDILTMIRRADRALYQAKTTGRDRCVVG